MRQKQRIPCKHACCVLSKLGKEPGDVADDGFSQHVLLSMLDRAIGGHPGPDWKIIHDLVANNGILSDAGLEAMYSAVSATTPFPKASFKLFEKAWREDESHDVQPVAPEHFIDEDGKCPCPLCDGKITRKNKRGRKKRARVSARLSTRAPL